MIFARSGRLESRVKKLHSNSGRNLRVHEAMLRKTIAVAEETGLPFFVVGDKAQHGSSFGERLSNAFSEVFENGFDKVIAIGSDCVALESSHLIQSADQLCKGQNVLGPDLRGGVYLIGLKRDAFESVDFAQLPWNSKQTANALQESISSNGSEVYLLGLLADINDSHEWRKVLQLHVSSFIQYVILPIIRDRIKSFVRQNFAIVSVLHQTAILRGPPNVMC